MTAITINQEKIVITGHSEYAEYGKDIVCAAISTLVQATINYLNATDNSIEVMEGDAYIDITLKEINEVGNNIITTFETMIKDLYEQYPNNIRRL